MASVSLCENNGRIQRNHIDQKFLFLNLNLGTNLELSLFISCGLCKLVLHIFNLLKTWALNDTKCFGNTKVKKKKGCRFSSFFLCNS
uniref:Uncharacterized protein n=1 Tax=Anguilla anguilla TaxID=7936 RepID=A0A0E9W5S0_ANGAN